MRASADTLLPFIRAVRRRMVLLRLLERTGLAVASASVVGLLLAAILIYRGQSAGELLTVLLGLAALAGIVWGLTNLPTRLAAAEEADRQLDLADLFSTALSLGPIPFDQPFAHAVRHLAAQRAAALSPSALVLRRLTGRAWSGIGLTTALALAAGLLSSRPGLIQAQDHASPFVALNHITAADRPHSAGPTWPAAIRPPRPREGFDESDSMAGGDANSPTPGNSATEARPVGTDQSNATGDQGSGQSSTPAGEHRPSDPELHPTDANTSDAAGRLATGSGRSTTGASANDPGSTSTTGNPGGRAAPPWRSGNWETIRAGALHEADQSGIPDTYRDLLRDYFGR